MRSLTSLVAATAFAASTMVLLPVDAEALPVVSPAAIESAALPVEHTAFFGRRCFRRFGWHGPGFYRCGFGGYGYGYGYGGGRRFGGGRFGGGFGHGGIGGHGFGGHGFGGHGGGGHGGGHGGHR